MTTASGAVDRGQSGSGLVVGIVDVVVIASLVLYGFVTHGGSPVADPAGAVETITPFVVGWGVAVALGDPYGESAFDSAVGAARTVSLYWLAAANVGMVLRASPWFEGGVAWAFPLVMTGIGLVGLVGWRVAYVVFRS